VRIEALNKTKRKKNNYLSISVTKKFDMYTNICYLFLSESPKRESVSGIKRFGCRDEK